MLILTAPSLSKASLIQKLRQIERIDVIFAHFIKLNWVLISSGYGLSWIGFDF